MSIDYRRVENAFQLLNNFSGDIPLDNYLRAVFRQNKNWGSKDRRMYREICFRFFRLYDRSKLSKDIVKEINETLNVSELMSDYNPYQKLKLETSVGKVDLGIWFKKRPPVFITGELELLKTLSKELSNNEMEYTNHGSFIESPNQLSEAHYPVLKGLQIMDRGSLEACLNLSITENDTVWDACSGSGGKTFAIARTYSPKQMISSDIRKKSLSNLQKRAKQLNQFADTHVLDASCDNPDIKPTVIVIDAPCSGSGTWRRNPDRAYYFEEQKLNAYLDKQKSILSNIAQQASSGCQIIYITCSVFRKENEEQLEFAQNLGLQLTKSEMLGGLNLNSDYLFRAVFTKP